MPCESMDRRSCAASDPQPSRCDWRSSSPGWPNFSDNGRGLLKTGVRQCSPFVRPSFAHLQQRAATAGVMEGEEKGGGAERQIDDIERYRGKEVIGAENAREQHRAHSLENIGRGQCP